MHVPWTQVAPAPQAGSQGFGTSSAQASVPTAIDISPSSAAVRIAAY
jgi:hypothetical protein